ncbi:hypothetical protein EK21DRAFT_106615 [Setomelanomma holmii]|uniref:Uncharacterized protein n=1 Tax=Setomelanomma holmii TaxID=210430 RepID=A0A9P4HIB8_9PLEO|nr:hypothetical protein EK21DRAFT_106615 [Setomelanomma holmii]
MSTITARSTDNQQASPFLSLPPELRNIIYRYILHIGELRILKILDSITILIQTDSSDPTPSNPPAHLLAITAINRQIHSETHLLPFQLNTFSSQWQSCFFKFSSSLTSQQRSAITTVKLLFTKQQRRTFESLRRFVVSDANLQRTAEAVLHNLYGVKVAVLGEVDCYRKVGPRSRENMLVAVRRTLKGLGRGAAVRWETDA